MCVCVSAIFNVHWCRSIVLLHIRFETWIHLSTLIWVCRRLVRRCSDWNIAFAFSHCSRNMHCVSVCSCVTSWHGTRVNESCHRYEGVMSQVLRGNATGVKGSCLVRIVTGQSQYARCLCVLLLYLLACHTYEWVTSHVNETHQMCCSVLQCMTVCCSVLQCVAVCCLTLQCVAVYCSVWQCVAMCCSVLQCVAVCCSVLQCDAVCCSVLQCTNTNSLIKTSEASKSKKCQCVAVCCSVLQCVAVCCSILQHVAVWYNVLQCVATSCSVWDIEESYVFCFALRLRYWHTHTHTHTHTYAHTHAHTYMHIHTCTHMQAHKRQYTKMKTHAFTRSHTHSQTHSFICATWLIHDDSCNITDAYCDMTLRYLWRDSSMCNMTDAHIHVTCHVTCIHTSHVTWLFDICDMTHSYMIDVTGEECLVCDSVRAPVHRWSHVTYI